MYHMFHNPSRLQLNFILSKQPLAAQAQCTHSVPLHEAETSVSMETCQADASTSGTRLVQTACEGRQRHFTAAPTATSSSLTAVDWIPGYLSPSWRGLNTKDERVPSSITCRTAGACTSGWWLHERCLHALRVDEDAVLHARCPVARFAIGLGSMLGQRMITEVVLPGCL